MKKLINKQNNNYSMVKKFTIFLFLLVALSFNGFSAEINVTTCPTFASGNTYHLQVGYTDATCEVTADNVIITSDGIDLDSSITFSVGDTRTGVVFDDIKTNEFGVFISGTITDMVVSNLDIDNFDGADITGSAGVSGLFSTSSIATLNNLTIENNYLYSRSDSGTGSNLFAVYSSSGTKSITLNNLNMNYNDFLGLQSLFYNSAGISHTARITLNDLDSNNNVYGMRVFNVNTGAGTKQMLFDTSVSCGISFGGNDLLAFQSFTSDNDVDFQDDVITTLTSGSCTYYNNYLPSQVSMNTKPLSKAFMFSVGSPNYYDDNRDYYLAKDLTLNTAEYINFQNAQYSTLYLPLTSSLTTTATNLIRMGSNNKLIGMDEISQSSILTSGTIDETYLFSDAFATNWALINYYSDFEVNNILFTGSISGNYGYIRPTSSLNGDFLKVYNSTFDTNGVMNQPSTPVIYSGDFAKIIGNTFDIRGSHDRTFRGGTNGGNIYQDNTFIGAGEVFQDMFTSGATFVTLANNNKFMDGGVFTSLPFSLVNANTNDASSFLLNGDYKYEQICDLYTFDVGNWYDDFSDTGACNDVDSDDICDIGVLRTNGTELIYDNQVLEVYPYNFGLHTGSIVPQDLCGAFTFNVDKPINNTDYPSATSFDVSWGFTSGSYPTMDCFMKMNDNVVLLTGVTSGSSLDYTYPISTGAYNFEITCENEVVTKSSGIYSFQINNGTDYVSVTDPSVTTETGGTGGTNGTTTGDGNSSFGGGSTEYDLITDDIDTTFDNVLGLISDFSNTTASILIPFAIFIFVMFIVFAVINLLHL